MKQALVVLLGAALLAGAASAQGAAGGGKKPTIGEQIKEQGIAGPGFVQEQFLGGLETKLGETFGETKGDQYMESLGKNPDVTSDDMVDLMNGEVSESELQKMFGAPKSDSKQIEGCVKEQVGDKNKCMFFGMVLIVVIGDFGMDPTSDFTKQIAGSREGIKEEDFQKLLQSNVSTNTIGKCFGFENKDDQKLMQEILNALQQCPFVNHPMAKSLGMGDKKPLDRSKFPQLGAGMPGSGEAFAGGEAGGCPFDMEMPPCPFFGSNLDSFFSGCATGGGETTEGTTGE